MNKIRLAGCVNNEPVYNHECYGEKFYLMYLEVLRKSGNSDIIKCIVPEVLKTTISQHEGIEVIGEVRTRNYDREDGTRGCDVFVFVRELNEYSGEDVNEITIDGFICKQPVYRKTPLGRKICDVVIASHREKTKLSDYIPCITWGRNAVRMVGINVGKEVNVTGRLQSREYVKHLGDSSEETRTAYEVSIATVRECEEDGE